jgi:hypothetical protein
MSRNMIPGFGKSGIVRIRALRSSLAWVIANSALG